jgi:CRP-like cAMP-binding protein
MFALVEGSVAVTAAAGRNEPFAIAELSAGDFVGEMSLLTGARRSATVEALTDVVAVEIPKVALEDILARAPELVDRFGTVLARRQAERQQAAADAARSGTGHFVSQIKRFFGM